MYGIFTYMYRNNNPNVGKYAIHGSYGMGTYSHPLVRRLFVDFEVRTPTSTKPFSWKGFAGAKGLAVAVI